MNRPYRFGGDLSQHTDKSQFKSPPNIQTSSRPKINGSCKERPREERSLPSANTGRAPSGMGATMFALSPLGNKKPFSKKGFCGAFSLKKRPSAPQRPPRPQAPSSPRRHPHPCRSRGAFILTRFVYRPQIVPEIRRTVTPGVMVTIPVVGSCV